MKAGICSRDGNEFAIAESLVNKTEMVILDDLSIPYKPEVIIYSIGMASATGMMPRGLFSNDRPHKKCLLPGCGEQTNHRGGYCCAEHCRIHKQIEKIKNKPNIIGVDLATARDFGCKVVAHQENDKIVIDQIIFLNKL